MDALPPSPPAVVTSEHQATLETLGRFMATRDWLDAQSSTLLDALDPPADDAAARRRQLDGFWNASVDGDADASAVTRRSAFTRRLVATLRDEARLRFADGTLDAAAHALVMKATLPGMLPPGVVAHELLMGDAVYPGAMVLEDSESPSLFLLFTGHTGWQSFTSLDALYEAFRDIVLASTDTHAPAVMLGDGAAYKVDDHTLVGSRALAADAWSLVVATIERTIALRVAEAATWPDDDSAGHEDRLRDRMAAAVSLDTWLDPVALVDARETRLVDAAMKTRLARSVKPLAGEWRAAAHAYAAALRDAAIPVKTLDLPGFARTRLATELHALGIQDAPGTLLLRRHRAGGSAHKVLRWTEDSPLVDASLQSIGWLNLAPVEVVGAGDGRVRLMHGATVDLIRRLDLHASYPAYLDRALRSSPEGARHREQAMHVMSARMRFELEEARATMYIPGATSDLLADHAERGYEFVRAVIDSPDEGARRLVDGHAIEVRQLELKGARLVGVLEIGARHIRSVSRVILYTPDAPDGRAFREFADRADAMRGFFADPRFAAYLARRLPASWDGMAPDGTRARFCLACPTGTTRNAAWLDSGSEFIAVPVRADFRAADYDATIARLGLEAERFTRPTAEADFDDAAILGQVALETGLGALPLRVGVVIAAGRSLHAVWQGAEHLARRDQAAASAAFVDALAMGAELVAARVTARATLRSFFVPARHAAGKLQRVGLPAASRPLPFERRFLATGIDRRRLRSIDGEIFTDGRQHVIEQDGHLFQVTRDQANATWRLAVPGGAATAYRPPVRYHAGRWAHRRDVGLLGGSGRDLRIDESASDVLERLYRRSDDTRQLTPGQRRALLNALDETAEMTSAALKKVIHDAIAGRATRATRMRWNAALERARMHVGPQMPALPPAPAPVGYRTVKLERSEWPDKVYHYTKRATFDEHMRGTRGDLYLHQSTPKEGRAAGLYTMSLGTDEPNERIATVMRGRSWVQRNRGGPGQPGKVDEVARAWIEIDMRALRDRQRADGTYEFNVYTVSNRTPHEFVIRPTLVGDAGDGLPPSPSHSPELMSIRLRPGEYRMGTR
ncbi:MAG: DUF6543 domain-containing protein [Luteibacter sp.]